MKELTRIVTVEITSIVNYEKDSEICSKEKAAESVKRELLAYKDIDDVVVTNVQDFILDK